ncbi:hypothetical protein [Thiomicrospira microaerophila]|uniref:hypothetical protein n=1 Tax=Thiomicrospira microaerophila TaxID=406020 RepID=UPI0005C8259A|nr:hypothetical protein [Thiomicrospira microaerophila]
MIETYEDLYAIVNQAMAENPSDVVTMTIADNQACHLVHTPSGRKVVLMLARLDEEFRIGFAYFAPRKRQADWIDDVIAHGVSSAFIHQLIEDNLLNAPSY